MASISAVVLTQNEEKFLPNCLKSLTWTDEIIIIDAGSTDKTIQIAQKSGAIVISSSWEGFSQQRNRGAQAASSDWLLYVDSDERVSKELRTEIQQLLNQKKIQHNSYKIPRKNIILGKWLKHGGWYPEPQHRLMRKQALEGWVGKLHEHPKVTGSVGFLKNDLIHLTHRGMGWMLEKTIRYTKAEAEARLQAKHPQVRVKHLFSAPLREFWFRAISKNGWKDGVEGWIEIFYQAFNHFLIMAWLWEMQRKKDLNQTYEEYDLKITNEL